VVSKTVSSSDSVSCTCPGRARAWVSNGRREGEVDAIVVCMKPAGNTRGCIQGGLLAAATGPARARAFAGGRGASCTSER